MRVHHKGMYPHEKFTFNRTVSDQLMRQYLTLACSAILGIVPAQAYIFSANFNSGNIPRTFTVENAAGVAVAEGCYRYGYTNNGWIAEQVDGGRYAAVCPSHTGTSTALESNLILPPLTISGNAPMLRWNAISIYGFVPESYRVSVTEAGNTTEIFSTDSENDVWTTRAADLTPWIGKEVTITFTCTSVNRYMLAIDDILVGDAEDDLFRVDATGTPLMAFGDGSTTISGTVTNVGKDAAFSSLALYIGDDKADEITLTAPLKGCESMDYGFTLPLTLNTLIEYTIKGEGGDLPVELYSGKAYATNYRRNLVVDKGTGMWCNNCPDGTLMIENLQRTYGDNIIPLAIHARPDMFACEDYWTRLDWYSVPRLMMNRDKSTENDAGSTSGTSMDSQIFLPTDFCIDITETSFTDDTLTVTAAVRSADDLNNAGDRYRIGYTLLTDVITDGFDPEIYQSNNAANASKRQYYYLPTTIPSDLAPMENIVLTGGDEAFDGIPRSLAAMFEADKPLTHTWVVSRPDRLDTWTDGKLAAYVIDTATGQIMNSTITEITEPADPGSISKNITEDAPVEYFTIQGMRVANPGKGLFIKRQGSNVTKVIL